MNRDVLTADSNIPIYYLYTHTYRIEVGKRKKYYYTYYREEQLPNVINHRVLK